MLGSLLLGSLLLAATIAAGCTGPQEEEHDSSPVAPAPAASVTLRIVLGDDPQLGSAIELLKGEWRELTGGDYELIPPPAVEDAAEPDADLIIFPARMLGELCEHGQLRPVRESVLAAEQLDYQDFYPAVRDELLQHGGRTMALPLGCPIPLLLTKGSEPASWAGVARPGEAADPTPAARLSPALHFLALGAAYATHETRESVLFETQSMRPTLEGPPFVAALRELAAAPGVAGATSRVILPARPADQQPAAEDRQWRHVQPLPGVLKSYNPLSHEWQTLNGSPRRVSLIGVEGRLVGVTTASRNAAAAFRLAGWLAGKSNARQLATCCPAVANVRRSLSRFPDNWRGVESRGLGRETAAALDQAWLADERWVLPRLIGIDRYLAILDEEVRRALAGQVTPEQALGQAVTRWEELTDRLGRDQQRQAYLRHLGVLEYAPDKR